MPSTPLNHLVPTTLAQAEAATSDLEPYLPIAVVLVMAILFGVINMVGTRLLGPTRIGETKGIAYESGMNPVGGARKRFNVRFYILAMTFLVFDVEVIFLYPWATTFAQIGAGTDTTMLFLGRALFFLLTTVIAYVYAFRKGVFRFD